MGDGERVRERKRRVTEEGERGETRERELDRDSEGEKEIQL